jgi:hypothetical protein
LRFACHVLRYHMIDIDLSKRQGLRAIYASSFVSQPNSMPNIKFDLLRRHLSTLRNRKGNVQSSAHTMGRGPGIHGQLQGPPHYHRSIGTGILAFGQEPLIHAITRWGRLLGQIRISNDKRPSVPE